MYNQNLDHDKDNVPCENLCLDKDHTIHSLIEQIQIESSNDIHNVLDYLIK